MLKLCQPWSLLGWIVNIIEGPIPPISSKFFIFKLVKVISYMKKLPNHVTDITSNLLSKCATKESMFHRLHMVWTTMLATLVNCDWDPPSSFFHGIALLRTNQRKATSLCTLYLSQISLHLRDKEGEFSFFHLSWIDFLESELCSVPISTKLGKVCQENSHIGQPTSCWVKEELI